MQWDEDAGVLMHRLFGRDIDYVEDMSCYYWLALLWKVLNV